MSMGVVSDGSYGAPEGIITSFPCTAQGRRVPDRPGPRHRRLQPRAHRQEQRRARRRARRRPRARPDLSAATGAGDQLQELAGGVVGEDLAAGLARGAVGHGVVAVLHGAHDVAALRAGLADAVVHVRGAVGGRAHLVEAALEGEALRRCTRGSPRTSRVDVVAVELARVGERREPRPVAHLVGEQPPHPGEEVLVAEEPVQPHRVVLEQRGERRPCRACRPRDRGRASGACSSGSPSTTHTPALRSVPASVRSSARPSAKRQRAWPNRGLADCFSSGLRRPPCIRWTTKVTLAEVEQEVLAPAAHEDELVAVRGVGRRGWPS